MHAIRGVIYLCLIAIIINYREESFLTEMPQMVCRWATRYSFRCLTGVKTESHFYNYSKCIKVGILFENVLSTSCDFCHSSPYFLQFPLAYFKHVIKSMAWKKDWATLVSIISLWEPKQKVRMQCPVIALSWAFPRARPWLSGACQKEHQGQTGQIPPRGLRFQVSLA